MVHDPRWAHLRPPSRPPRHVACLCLTKEERAACEGLCLLHEPFLGHAWPPPDPWDRVMPRYLGHSNGLVLAGSNRGGNLRQVIHPGPPDDDAPRATRSSQ